ncbi:MAG: acyloxyacyl hydrolase [Sulfurovum sp.]|nr:MAG: acyloxyacyl hydrolase [Sulfurovum sp.]
MKRWFLILSLYSFTINSFAEDTHFINEVSIGIGESKDNIGIYRLGAKKNFETTFFESDYGWLSGYYEASLNYWEKEGDQIYGIVLSPVFVYYMGSKSNTIHPYIEASIGVACISDTMIQGRNMTTNFQFEDRVGAGIKMESFDLNARYMHYSNASIKQPNSGIDIFIFTMSYIF